MTDKIRQEKRQHIINDWFQAWHQPDWANFEQIFDTEVYYSECWGPEYQGISQVKTWFKHWHSKSKLLVWEITAIHHVQAHTFVTWHFACQSDHKTIAFEGLSDIQWTGLKVKLVKEYSSQLPKYNPVAQ
ncbi:MAG: nuclear transport factor 2 family protein [Streptococcaceae bacterium]|nr:nuclear transport factor 2 family protein [Streptococcaceae bacterium]